MPLKGLGRAGKAPERDAQNIREYLEQFSSVPILNGQLVTVTFPAGTFLARAAHSLNRVPRGAFTTSSDGFCIATLFESPNATDDPRKYAYLGLPTTAAVDTAVTVWIF